MTHPDGKTKRHRKKGTRSSLRVDASAETWAAGPIEVILVELKRPSHRNNQRLRSFAISAIERRVAVERSGSCEYI